MARQTPQADAPIRGPQLHSVETAAKRLSLGRARTYELVGSGELRSVRIGHRRLVPESAIVEFIDALEREAEQA